MHMILVSRGPDTGAMVSWMDRDAVWGQRVLWVGTCGVKDRSASACKGSPGATCRVVETSVTCCN